MFTCQFRPRHCLILYVSQCTCFMIYAGPHCTPRPTAKGGADEGDGEGKWMDDWECGVLRVGVESDDNALDWREVQ